MKQTVTFILLCLAVFQFWGCGSSSPDEHPVFQKQILLGAHRGGDQVYPENTLYGFQQAAKDFPEVLLEADARLTTDGAVILMHDDTVDRTTDGAGAIEEKTLAEMKALDAAYRFTKDGGQTFPHRGQGITVPTLRELLEALPNERFLIEFKGSPALADAGIAIMRELNALDRIIIASFTPETMARVRELAPEAVTCYDFSDGAKMLAALRGGNWTDYKPKNEMLSLMRRMVKQYELTSDDFHSIQAKGVKVQIHTVNEVAEMHQWLDIGVDSILTDRPDLLARVIADRNP
jgi:glycerophosphoryl diester phosphodiesterase